MDYEKLYKEALKRAREELGSGCFDKGTVEYIFPELKESEDENIIEEIKDLVKSAPLIMGLDKDKIFAWLEKQGKKDKLIKELSKYKVKYTQEVLSQQLEKQGEQNNQHLYDIIIALWDLLDKIDTFSDLQIDDTNPDNPFRKIEDITQERHKFVKSDGYDLFIEDFMITNDKNSEKQGEQNPADKVEPKFKVGDWITNNYAVWYIESIHDGLYSLKDPNGGVIKNSNPETVDNKFHLWTIQDAKDGDVLEFGDHGRLVVGIVSFVNKRTGKVDVSCLLEDNKFKIGNFYALDTIKPHPATKEQRDILFQKMKEAGYEWNVEKKEL